MKCFYSIIILLTLNPSILAQEISNNCDTCAILKGRVINSITKELLIGANIILVSTSSGATTDLDGNFLISDLVPKKYELRCSFIGYPIFSDSIQLYIKETKIITIEMLNEEDVLAGQALIDIQKGELKIYLDGWPIFRAPLDEINIVAEKYGFQYVFDGSCYPFAFHWDKYNELIKAHLDDINGIEWRVEIEEELEELYKKYSE